MFTAGRVAVPVVPDLSGFQKTIAAQGRQAGGGFSQGFGKETKRSRLGGMIVTGMKRTAIGGALAVGAAAGVATVSGFKSAIDQQKSEKTLAGLYNSAGTAKRIMKDLRKVSQSSSIDYSSYTKTAETLAYMGVQGKDVGPILKNMGKMITGAGGSSEDLERAGDAMLKMVNSGKVYAADLNQLSQTGIPVVSGLATKMFGDSSAASIAKMREAVTKGKVSVEDVQSVIKNATGKNAKAQIRAADQVEKTLSATWKRTKDNVVSSIGAMMRPLLTKLTPALDSVGKAVSRGIGGIPKAFAGVKGASGALRDFLVPIGRTIADTYGKTITSIGDSVRTMLPAFQQIGTALRPIGSALLKAFGPVVADAFQALHGVTRAFYAVLSEVVVAIGNFASKHGTAFRAIIIGIGIAVGLAVAPFTTLALAVVYAYKRFGWFRTIVQAVWTSVKFLGSIVASVFKAIGTAIAFWWKNIAHPMLSAFRLYLTKWVFPIVRFFYNGVVKPIFKVITFAIRAWWFAARLIFAAFRTYLQKWVFPVIRFLYDHVVRPYFNAVGKIIGVVWRSAIRPSFNAIRGGVQKVGDTVGKIVGAITRTWAGLRSAFAGPVNWIINNVINKLIGAINKVSGWVKGPTLKKVGNVGGGGGGKKNNVPKALRRPKAGISFAGGGVMPGYTPGRDVHHFASPTAGNLALSGGEAIMVPEWTAAVGGRRAVEAMNAAARQRRSFKGGGLLDVGPRDTNVDVRAAAKRIFKPVPGTYSTYPGHTGVDINSPNDYGKPIHAAADGIISAVKHLTTSYGNHVIEQAGKYSLIYGHMSRTMATPNKAVKAGQVIGKVGSTGNSTGPHLHFEVRPDGSYSSAVRFLRGALPLGDTPGGQDPVSYIRGRLTAIKKKAKDAPGGKLGPGIATGIPGKLGGSMLDWAKKKADKLATMFSPAYALGKWAVGKILGGTKGDIQRAVKNSMSRYGWGPGQWGALNSLIQNESGWDPNAANQTSSARGLFQKMTSLHGPAGGVKDQIAWGLNYIKSTYGTPANAWRKWQSRTPHWYASGTPSAAPGMAWVGERGPELVHFGGGERVLSHRQSMAGAGGQGGPAARIRQLQRRLRKVMAPLVELSTGQLTKRLGNLSMRPTLTRRINKQTARMDQLRRKIAKADSAAERKKLRARLNDLRDARKANYRERKLVTRMTRRRRVLMLRQAKAMPRGLTVAEAAASETPDPTNARMRAERNRAIAKARALPVQERLAQVGRGLKGARSPRALRRGIIQQRIKIQKAHKRLDNADTAAEKKKARKDLAAAQKRRDALQKERRRVVRLRKEQKRLGGDQRLKALTKAQEAYNRAKEAETAAIERAGAISSAAMGLGTIEATETKTSYGIVANLRRAVQTTRSWGVMVRDLIGAGLRGPILDEFIDAGPSDEALALGRSLLAGGQIATINKLQEELKKEATGAAAAGTSKIPAAKAKAPGSWNAATLSYNTPGQVDMSAGAGNGRTVNVYYTGMPADTVDSIAAKTTDRLMREATKAGV